MTLQADISAEKLKRFIGKELTVLVDEIGQDQIIARSYADAPEIDGVVYVQSQREVNVGDYISVTINDADNYDLYATEKSAN